MLINEKEIWIKNFKRKNKEIEITLVLYEKEVSIKSSSCNAEEIFIKLPKKLSFEVGMGSHICFSNYLVGHELCLSDEELNKIHINKLLRLHYYY